MAKKQGNTGKAKPAKVKPANEEEQVQTPLVQTPAPASEAPDNIKPKGEEFKKPVVEQEEKKPNRGIVLIALGSPQYGRMAANLAASIRFADNGIAIHLVYSGSSITHLSPDHKKLFTSMAECPREYYLKGGKEVYLKAKTCIYELSPFEETIMMDVDLIFCDSRKKASSLFEQLKNIEWTMQNRGYADLSKDILPSHFCQWCDINDVKKVYETTGRFYHLASEFIYFKRSDDNEKYFKLVRDIFDNPLIPGKLFNGDLPDEFAFDIASAILGKYPHQDNWVPIYWFAVDNKKLETNDIIKQYYGISIGGADVPNKFLKGSSPSPAGLYDRISEFYSVRLGLKPMTIYPKQEWNQLRKKL